MTDADVCEQLAQGRYTRRQNGRQSNLRDLPKGQRALTVTPPGHVHKPRVKSAVRDFLV